MNLLKSIFISGFMMLIAALTFTALLMILQGGNTLGWLGVLLNSAPLMLLLGWLMITRSVAPNPRFFSMYCEIIRL